MFNFEYFNPNLGSITVSIAEYGLTFSRAAVEVLGRPEYIVLAYDRDKQVIGVIPTSENESNRIEFISKVKNGYVRVNTKDFVRFLMKFYPDNPQMFGSRANRYFSYWNDENKVLVVDLKRPLDGQNEDDADGNTENGEKINR